MINLVWDEYREITDEQWSKVEIKLGTIEDRLKLQIENAMMDYVSEKMDAEEVKKKPWTWIFKEKTWSGNK